jgi:hypothetical protein
LPQRDYILRVIEQLGAALAALRRRILGRREDPAKLRDELATLAQRAGFDLDVLRALSGETLHMLVSPAGEVEPARCWLMAELLYADGVHALAEERAADAAASLGKARLLFGLIAPGGGLLVGLPEAGARAREIDALLEER